MTRRYGLSIDPGMSTGACLFSWGNAPDEPFKQEAVWQFRNGAYGLEDWINSEGLVDSVSWGVIAEPTTRAAWIGIVRPVLLSALVVEKFTPRSNSGFALTQASVEPLRGEGVLIGHGLGQHITWQQPASQYFMGGNDLKERKIRSREFLKRNGIYLTGKNVGQPDADDAISAELHAIAYLRGIRHLPTLHAMFDA